MLPISRQPRGTEVYEAARRDLLLVRPFEITELDRDPSDGHDPDPNEVSIAGLAQMKHRVRRGNGEIRRRAETDGRPGDAQLP